MGLIGDVKYTLRGVDSAAEGEEERASGGRCEGLSRRCRKELDERAVVGSEGLVHPQYLAACISELAATDAVVLSCDVGDAYDPWSARYLKMGRWWEEAVGVVQPWDDGEHALPQAIGVQASA